MKKILTLFLMFALIVPAFARVDGDQAMYAGGTTESLKEGTVGKLNTTELAALSFDNPAGKFVIPYEKMESFEYTKKLAHELGVLPTIAVGLFKQLRYRHFVRIAYRDQNNASQVAIFEVAKGVPATLLPVLQSRAPQACRQLCNQPRPSPNRR